MFSEGSVVYQAEGKGRTFKRRTTETRTQGGKSGLDRTVLYWCLLAGDCGEAGKVCCAPVTGHFV